MGKNKPSRIEVDFPWSWWMPIQRSSLYSLTPRLFGIPDDSSDEEPDVPLLGPNGLPPGVTDDDVALYQQAKEKAQEVSLCWTIPYIKLMAVLAIRQSLSSFRSS